MAAWPAISQAAVWWAPWWRLPGTGSLAAFSSNGVASAFLHQDEATGTYAQYEAAACHIAGRSWKEKPARELQFYDVAPDRPRGSTRQLAAPTRPPSDAQHQQAALARPSLMARCQQALRRRLPPCPPGLRPHPCPCPSAWMSQPIDVLALPPLPSLPAEVRAPGPAREEDPRHPPPPDQGAGAAQGGASPGWPGRWPRR